MTLYLKLRTLRIALWGAFVISLGLATTFRDAGACNALQEQGQIERAAELEAVADRHLTDIATRPPGCFYTTKTQTGQVQRARSSR